MMDLNLDLDNPVFTNDIVDMIIEDLKKLGWESDNQYRWKVTGWNKNDSFGGSWEIWELGKTYEEFDAAIQPVERLHKAGAAHCRNFVSTVLLGCAGAVVDVRTCIEFLPTQCFFLLF